MQLQQQLTLLRESPLLHRLHRLRRLRKPHLLIPRKSIKPALLPHLRPRRPKEQVIRRFSRSLRPRTSPVSSRCPSGTHKPPVTKRLRPPGRRRPSINLSSSSCSSPRLPKASKQAWPRHLPEHSLRRLPLL